MCKSDTSVKDRLRVRFVGPFQASNSVSSVEGLCEHLGIGEVVSCEGRAPHKKVLECMRAADVFMLINKEVVSGDRAA